MKKLFVVCVAALAIAGCKKTEKENKLKVADWIIGSWENNMEQGRLTESWTKTNDSVLSGESYFIKDTDTLSNEKIRLVQLRGEVLYIPVVKGQNNDGPVEFKLKSATGKQLVFENLMHDFPQKITYRQITADSLVAEISGLQDGKPASESYPMKKK